MTNDELETGPTAGSCPHRNNPPIASSIAGGTSRGPAGASWSRRSFIHIAGVGTAMSGLALGTAAAASAADAALDAQEREVVLAVARAGAVFPVDFPAYDGEQAPAVDRATDARLDATLGRTNPDRIELARLAARSLHDTAGRQDLLDRLGRLADGADEPVRRGATALVALAVTTVSARFDPNRDEAADLWLEGIRILHVNGYFRQTR